MDSAYSLSNAIGYLSRREVEFLSRLAKSLRSGHRLKIVNIGAGAGTSALTIRLARPEAFLFTIDVKNEADIHGGLQAEINVLRQNNVLDDNYYLPMLGDSKSIGRKWGFGKVDMVFIDGDHSYEGCKGDIEIWLKNMNLYGVIALHDYKKAANNMPWPGVDKAVDEILTDQYQHLGTVDTMIAFRKKHIENWHKSNPRFNMITVEDEI